jgi:hypothetical protein
MLRFATAVRKTTARPIGYPWKPSDSKTYFPYLPDSADLIKARNEFFVLTIHNL